MLLATYKCAIILLTMNTNGAIYHYSGKVITRSVKGASGGREGRKSSVAAAAYQAGERLVLDMERNPFGVEMAEKEAGLVVIHDYTPRRADMSPSNKSMHLLVRLNGSMIGKHSGIK